MWAAVLSIAVVAAHGALPPMLPNIQQAARGYNIYFGNPQSTEGGDPGFVQYMVYKLTQTEGQIPVEGFSIPDRFNVYPETFCKIDFNSTTISTFTDYMASLEHDASQSTSGGFAGFGGKFSSSQDYKTFVENTEKTGRRMVSSSAECLKYEAYVDQVKPPSFSDDFKSLLDKLPSAYGDGEDYFNFIDNFGTHTIKSMKMGSRYGQISYFSEMNWTNVMKFSSDVTKASSVSASFLGGAHSSKDETKAERDARIAFDENKQSSYIISLGAKPLPDVYQWAEKSITAPEPIRYTLLPLWEATPSLWEAIPDGEAKKSNLKIALSRSEYCTKRLLKNPEYKGTCVEPRDIECSWDSDCNAGKACIKNKCYAGSVLLKYRPIGKDLVHSYCLQAVYTPAFYNQWIFYLEPCNFGNIYQRWVLKNADHQNNMQIKSGGLGDAFCMTGGSAGLPFLSMQLCVPGPPTSQTWARDVHKGALYLPNAGGVDSTACVDAGDGIFPNKPMVMVQCSNFDHQEFDAVEVPGVAEAEMPTLV